MAVICGFYLKSIILIKRETGRQKRWVIYPFMVRFSHFSIDVTAWGHRHQLFHYFLKLIVGALGPPDKDLCQWLMNMWFFRFVKPQCFKGAAIKLVIF